MKLNISDVSDEWKTSIYTSLLGLTNVDTMKSFLRDFDFKKPLYVFWKIATILMELSYSIWKTRCIHHAEQPAPGTPLTNHSTVGELYNTL